MSDTFYNTMQAWIELFMRRSMRDFMHFIRQKGYSMSQISAMLFVLRHGACGVSGVAEHLGITSAAASQLLERLVQQELIIRSEDPHDRRNKRISLTEKGQQTVADSLHARQKWIADLGEQLEPDEKELVISALEILSTKTRLLEEIKEQG